MLKDQLSDVANLKGNYPQETKTVKRRLMGPHLRKSFGRWEQRGEAPQAHVSNGKWWLCLWPSTGVSGSSAWILTGLPATEGRSINLGVCLPELQKLIAGWETGTVNKRWGAWIYHLRHGKSGRVTRQIPISVNSYYSLLRQGGETWIY